MKPYESVHHNAVGTPPGSTLPFLATSNILAIVAVPAADPID